jgi:hypothetical protein
MSSCYNPGYDLQFASIDKTACKKPCKKTYSPTCMYNTQGQYLCQVEKPTEELPIVDSDFGYMAIMGAGKKSS